MCKPQKVYGEIEFSCSANCIFNLPCGCKIVKDTGIAKLNTVGQCENLVMRGNDEQQTL